MLDDPSGFVPCTPLGVQRLLIESKININGAHVVVLGRSMIVGKPLALLLMQKNANANATVTVVHSRSRDLAEITRSADIIVAAIGRAGFVKADHVREGVVVIDVGINRVDDAATDVVIDWSATSRLTKYQKKRVRSRRCRVALDR